MTASSRSRTRPQGGPGSSRLSSGTRQQGHIPRRLPSLRSLERMPHGAAWARSSRSTRRGPPPRSSKSCVCSQVARCTPTAQGRPGPRRTGTGRRHCEPLAERAAEAGCSRCWSLVLLEDLKQAVGKAGDAVKRDQKVHVPVAEMRHGYLCAHEALKYSVRRVRVVSTAIADAVEV